MNTFNCVNVYTGQHVQFKTRYSFISLTCYLISWHVDWWAPERFVILEDQSRSVVCSWPFHLPLERRFQPVANAVIDSSGLIEFDGDSSG